MPTSPAPRQPRQPSWCRQRDRRGHHEWLSGLEGISVTPDGAMVFVADGGRGESVPYNRVRSIKMP
jgi:hypothetical protein